MTMALESKRQTNDSASGAVQRLSDCWEGSTTHPRRASGLQSRRGKGYGYFPCSTPSNRLDLYAISLPRTFFFASAPHISVFRCLQTATYDRAHQFWPLPRLKACRFSPLLLGDLDIKNPPSCCIMPSWSRLLPMWKDGRTSSHQSR